MISGCFSKKLFYFLFGNKSVDQVSKFIKAVSSYKNQQAYLAIPVGDIKGLMILKNVLSCFKPSYRSVPINPRFL